MSGLFGLGPPALLVVVEWRIDGLSRSAQDSLYSGIISRNTSILGCLKANHLSSIADTGSHILYVDNLVMHYTLPRRY